MMIFIFFLLPVVDAFRIHVIKYKSSGYGIFLLLLLQAIQNNYDLKKEILSDKTYQCNEIIAQLSVTTTNIG
jgi:hypothetical protein